MQGAGNDFVVIDNFELALSAERIISIAPKVCNRKFGVGADGILALHPSKNKDLDFTMIYRNADGSDAGMCGNGARCLALFAQKKGLGNAFNFNIHGQKYHAIVKKNTVSVAFPDVKKPKFIEIDGHELIQVYPGTEHVVKRVPRSYLEQEKNLVQVGRKIRNHKSLNPPGCNVNYMTVSTDDCIYLQTYERGVENLTMACGTGTIASAIAAHYSKIQHTAHKNVTVKVTGGTLNVSFNFVEKTNTYTNIKLKGPAHFVFSGKIEV